MSYRPEGDRERPGRARGAGHLRDAARRIDGLAPVRRDREQRGLAYSVAAFDHAFADVPILQLSAGLDSTKTVEAYQRMREIVTELRDDGPTEGEVERARAYAAGRRVLAFENTGAVARHAAYQAIVYGEDMDPDAAIAALDAVTYDQVNEVARGVADRLALAVVGPHDANEFS